MSDTMSSRAGTRSRFGRVVLALLIAMIVGAALALYVASLQERWMPVWLVDAPSTSIASPTPAATTSPPPAPLAPVDPQVLADRTALLAAQLASLEARAAGIATDADQAAGQAARAEAMLVAFAARRALDRGLALGYLEQQLHARFGAVRSAAVERVIAAGRQPITLNMLRTELDSAAPELARAGDGWLQGLGGELQRLVVIHDAGSVSPLPRDRLARTRRLLETGQVASALEEAERMPGIERAPGWREAARRYVETRQALDVLEATALLGQARSDQPTVLPPQTLENG